jgi:drug/metabolite transporter (DMT)-like permease
VVTVVVGAAIKVRRMVMLSVLLAVSSALAFASSTVLQQGTARSTALRHGTGRLSWLPVLAFFGTMVRQPAWLIGYGLNAVGFVLHVVALHLGAIAIVQAVLVIQLLFALLISAVRRHLRPTPRDWLGAASVCAGIATLVLLRGDVDQQVASRGKVAVFAVVVVLALTTVLPVARALRRRPQIRTALVAVGAGMCFCTTAVFVVVVTDEVAHSGLSGLVGAPMLGIVASATVGTLFVQDAFASGSLPTAVTAMTITDPVGSSVVGALLFDATPPAGLELWLGLPVAGALIVTGVTLLATSATLHDECHLHAALEALPALERRRSNGGRSLDRAHVL